MALLKISGLTKRFGGLAANENVSFDVTGGEIVGLIGPNGAGKTTLFNCITGVYPINGGTVRFEGEEIQHLRSYDICKLGIARTFQLVQVFPDMTSLENVAVGALLKTRDLALARTRSLNFLERLNLSDRQNIPAKNLTVADRKKLELARALATEPRLLLLDEVAGGLNPAEVSELIEIVRQINRQGITIVMIEHVMEAVMNIAGRIVVLDSGRKIAEGTPQEIVSDALVVEAYLGEGYHARG
jgi:branched-chain amino acid transport system ATP-binding protein